MVMNGLKPVILMVIVQIVYASMNVLLKLAVEDGMNLKVLVAYRMAFATSFVVPLALILERNSRPRLTKMILFQGFLCGLFGGVLPLNCYVEGLALTSATFASAMSNLTPVITFVLSICFRLERVGLGTVAGKAKVLGTCLGISGAMLLTFYKGLQINFWATHVNLASHHHHTTKATTHAANPLLGAFFSLGCSFSYSIWLILQTKMSERYPCQYSSSALMCAMGTIQAVVVAVCMERKGSEWKLGHGIRLYTAAYSGIVAFGLAVVMIAWCARVRGPLFVSNFNPLSALAVTIAAYLLLDEKLHLGSFLGAVLIVCGLYLVLWGRSKEMKNIVMEMELPSKTSSSSSMFSSNSHSSSTTSSDDAHQQPTPQLGVDRDGEAILVITQHKKDGHDDDKPLQT